MNQTELPFFTLPSNPFSSGTQCHALYEWLRERGEISTREIHRSGFETARIRSDIRPYLRRNGLDYRCKYLEPGNRLYQVVGGNHAN